MRFLVGAFVTCMIGLFVFIIVDMAVGEWSKPETGTVADRQYVPEQITYTTRTRSDGSTYTDREVEPEKWLVIVSLREDAVTINAGRPTWNKAYPGSTVWVKYRKGGLSGGKYAYQIVQTQGGGSNGGAGAAASF